MAKKTKVESTELAVNPKNTALAEPLEDWQIELQKEAKAEVAKESTGMPRVGHGNAGLNIDGKPVAGGKLKLAIVDYIFAKQYFAERYSPGRGGTPSCYAYGTEEAGMAPHPQSSSPQCASCAECKHNKFGTAELGNGKRCADVRKLGVIVEVQDEGSIQNAEVRSLAVPPGSLKNWGKYLRTVPDLTSTGNVRELLTEVGTEPKGGAYALTFRPVERLAPGFVRALLRKREAVRADLMQPWPQLDKEADSEEAQPKKRSKKF